MQNVDRELWRARDVTRLLALVERERRYFQELVSVVPVGLAACNADLTVTATNRAFRRIFGLEAGALRPGAENPEPLPAAIGVPELDSRLRDSLNSGQNSRFVLPVGGRDILFSAQPWHSGEDDAEMQLILSAQELSESMAAGAKPPEVETVPLESAQLLRRTIDRSPALVWEVDTESMKFQTVSTSALSEMGLSQEMWKEEGSFWPRDIYPEDLPMVKSFYQMMIGGSAPRECDYRAIATNGSVIWLRDLVRAERESESGPVRLRGVTVDITESRLQEDHRTSASKVAALQRLAGRVAHDGNNLLTILRGYHEEILQSLTPGHPARGSLHQILTAGYRLSALTSRLNEFSQRPAVTMQEFVLDAWINQVSAALRAPLPRNAELALELGAGDAVVQADAEQIEAALRSLLTGFTEAGAPGTITIRTVPMDVRKAAAGRTAGLDPGQYIRVEVWQPGVVMSPDMIERILDPANPEMKAPSLAGLYMSAVAMGGDFSVRSDEDRGTCFTLMLRRGTAKEEPAAAPPDPPQATEAPKQETILVVEDEAGIRALLRKILTRQGYNVIEASNGREALDVTRDFSGPIHLLISDIMMPEMGGIELANALRGQRPETRVLLISGYIGTGAASADLPAGAGFLQKPFTLNTLVGKVREILERRKGNAAGA